MNNIDYIDTTTISSYATDTISTTTLTSSGDYTISNTGYTFSDSDGNIVINTRDPVDFEDCMPILEKIQSMCKEYPGLDKAFDNFKIPFPIFMFQKMKIIHNAQIVFFCVKLSIKSFRYKLGVLLSSTTIVHISTTAYIDDTSHEC